MEALIMFAMFLPRDSVDLAYHEGRIVSENFSICSMEG